MLTEAQIERYARHVLLTEVGGAGQERLLAASVRIVGLDAPGAWAAAYLALAGVGRLVLDDPRPVISPAPMLIPADVGRPRGEAIAARLPSWNPDVRAVLDGSADAELRWDGAGTEGVVLHASASGEDVELAWSEVDCPRCRPAPREGPSPAAAALAGSLAASEVVLRLLGLAGPRRLRLLQGRPAEPVPCDHP